MGRLAPWGHLQVRSHDPSPFSPILPCPCCPRNTQTRRYINIYIYFATTLFKELVSRSQAGVRPPAPPQAAAGRREEWGSPGPPGRRGTAQPEDGKAASSPRPAERRGRGVMAAPLPPRAAGDALPPRVHPGEEVSGEGGFSQSASALRLCPASSPPPSAVNRAARLSLREPASRLSAPPLPLEGDRTALPPLGALSPPPIGGGGRARVGDWRAGEAGRDAAAGRAG